MHHLAAEINHCQTFFKPDKLSENINIHIIKNI